jgi:DNA-binding transcriptional MerR regulator
MYNIKMVSKLVNIPAVTIRAWERRYQVLQPQRTESGHRLYTDQDIEDLRWLKNQTEEKGLNISQAVKLLQKRRDELAAYDESKESIPNTGSSYDVLSNRLYDALLLFDTVKANTVLDLSFSMFHYEQVFHQIITPIMHRLGDEWENGSVSIAQEHFSTNLIIQRFYQFFRIFPINPALPKIVAFCSNGETHQVGLLLFTLFLRKNGADVIYLGADTPKSGLLELIERNHNDIVAISLTNKANKPNAIDLLDELSNKYPQLRFVLGGEGFSDIPAHWKKFRLNGKMDSWQKWFEQEVR